jgi:acyl-CoA synthetase (AMP-forming)/AMP-acid ligase II
MQAADTATVLAWLDEPAADRGIRVSGTPAEDWTFVSYRDLAESTHVVANSLLRAGVCRGDRVAIVARSGWEFAAMLFGAMLAGAVGVPIAPLAPFENPAQFQDRLNSLLHAARPRLLAASGELTHSVRAAAAAAGVEQVLAASALLTGPGCRRDAVAGAAGPLRAAQPSDLALLQFTSGSGGSARAIRVTHGALAANVAAIRQWLAWTADDPVATWLPLFHDMGLVGCFITPVVSQSDIWLMSPAEFVRRPVSYLRCFGERGARLTAMPNFALDYIVSRVPPTVLGGMDFSQWRAVIVGAERLDPRSLERFHALLGPHGLPRTALLPAYGLAEATLAVTGLPLGTEWSSARLSPAPIVLGKPVPLAAADGGTGQVVMGCGRPLAGLDVSVVDEAGNQLPESWAGEIVVRGSSVAAGYAGEAPGGTFFSGDEIRTADAGFLLDGQLFVLGRLGDCVKVRGRAVFAEELEDALRRSGIPSHRFAVALGLSRGEPTAIVLLERAEPAWLTDARRVLRRWSQDMKLVTAGVPAGAIARTSSGKVMRRRIWQAFAEGRLPGDPG